MTTPELIHTIFFYAFGVLAIAASLVAVKSKHILRAAVGLAVTLVCGAGFYILLDYDFIAGIQILVYVGGIVVLIVYAVMLTSSLELLETHPSKMRKLMGFITAAIFMVVSIVAITYSEFPINNAVSPPEDIASGMGRLLLGTGSGGYVLPFELISLLLLSAVIGGIVIARAKLPEENDDQKEVSN